MPDRRWSSLSRAVVPIALAAAVVAAGMAAASPDRVSTDAATGTLPSVTVHAVTAAMTNVTPHTGVTRTADCPAGTLVGGGGYVRNAADPATLPTNGLVLGGTDPSTGASPVDQPAADGATNPDTWMAVANFTGVAENGDQATAYALCATGGATQTVVASNSTVGANALQQVDPPTPTVATCPAGTTLLGGGAFTSTPDQVDDGTTVGNNGNLKPLGDYPSDAAGVPAADGSTSATSWSAYGSAGITSANDKVTAFALCTVDPISPVQVARADVSGPDAQAGTTITTATAECPAGTRLLGGGYRADQTVNGTSGLQPQQGYHMRGSFPSTGPAALPADVADGTADPSAWSALLQAGGQTLPTGTSMQLHTFAMCAQPSSSETSTSTTPSPTSTTPTSTSTTPTSTSSQAPGAVTTTTTVKAQTHPPRKGADGSVRPSARVAPGNPAGTVQFVVDGLPAGDPVPVRGGNVNGPVVPLGPGQHSVSARFTPADPAAFTPSESDPVTVTF